MNKHVNGYLPKIEYWKGKLNLAIEAGNVNGVEVASQKVQYFMTRQAEVYDGDGEVRRRTMDWIAGVDFSHSLNLLKNL
jgi:Asp-tRNA(Asn)/Glu-tRNA(Gln) amidotransferase B subunit